MKFLLALILIAASFGVSAQAPNQNVVLFPSAARTATPLNSSDFANLNYRGVIVIVNTSAYTSGNYTPHIQGKDSISGNYYDVVVGAAIAGTGTVVMKVYPGVTTATGVVSDVLPRNWRFQMIGAATPSMTFSASGMLQN